jgi:hypothetical protein
MSNIIKAYTPLKVADFSWVNQGSCTAYDVINGIVMYGPSQGGVGSLRMLVKSTPTPPYKLTIHFNNVDLDGGGGNWTGRGLCLRNSSTGQALEFTFACEQASPSTTYVQIRTWADSSTDTALVKNAANLFYDKHNIWLQTINDNTNITHKLSVDGVNWYQLFVHAKDAYFIEDQCGITINPGNKNTTVVFDSFKLEQL